MKAVPFLCVLLAAGFAHVACAADYDVGPGQPLRAIAEVPWASLLPGDNVNIHWRPEPYKEKWVICRAGTPQKPITVRGIKGPKGELPVIDGAGAVTVKSLDYPGEVRSVIKIGVASNRSAQTPANIVLQDLDVQNAHPSFSFQGRKKAAKYVAHAAAVWVELGSGITIRGCAIHGSANGLFVSHASRDILVERCHIYGNGIVKSVFQHNVYSEADGIVFRFNRFGPLRPGSPGNNLKDRSAGLVVHDNWIEGGNRELDLVDAEDDEALRKEPSYQRTFVYRNVIIEPAGAGNDQIVHYGGDSAKPGWYRKGTLYFYNNTVISKRKDKTALFRLMANDERVEARNNIFYTVGSGKTLAIADTVGQIDLSHNWIKRGWVNAHGPFKGSVKAAENLDGEAPGFVDEAAGDYRLAPGSLCRGAGEVPTVRDAPEGFGASGKADIGAPAMPR